MSFENLNLVEILIYVLVAFIALNTLGFAITMFRLNKAIRRHEKTAETVRRRAAPRIPEGACRADSCQVDPLGLDWTLTPVESGGAGL